MRQLYFYRIYNRGTFTRCMLIGKFTGDNGIDRDWILKIIEKLGENDQLLIRQKIDKETYIIGG